MPLYLLLHFAGCCDLHHLSTADRPPNTMQDQVAIALACFLLVHSSELQRFVGRGDTSFARFATCFLSVKYFKRPQRAFGGGMKPYLACGTSGLRQDGHGQAPADSGVEG